MREPHLSDDQPEYFDRGPEERSKGNSSFLSFLGELPVLIITAIVVAWLIKTFIVQPFFIPSGSMEPTLLPGDRVLVSKFTYRFEQPGPEDIVVFIAPEEEPQVEQDFIKRIVAMPGMTVEVKGGRLFVNGKTKKEPYIMSDIPNSSFGPTTVPRGKIFVMGDNRANSKDSRIFGPVKKTRLVGKAFFIYWPPGRVGILK